VTDDSSVWGLEIPFRSRAWQIKTVAVYSDADRHAQFVKMVRLLVGLSD
jgi:acetyl/propionyl-CoA carboxylase alpha subunit